MGCLNPAIDIVQGLKEIMFRTRLSEPAPEIGAEGWGYWLESGKPQEVRGPGLGEGMRVLGCDETEVVGRGAFGAGGSVGVGGRIVGFQMGLLVEDPPAWLTAVEVTLVDGLKWGRAEFS